MVVTSDKGSLSSLPPPPPPVVFPVCSRTHCPWSTSHALTRVVGWQKPGTVRAAAPAPPPPPAPIVTAKSTSPPAEAPQSPASDTWVNILRPAMQRLRLNRSNNPELIGAVSAKLEELANADPAALDELARELVSSLQRYVFTFLLGRRTL
jgi:hypothetical protein